MAAAVPDRRELPLDGAAGASRLRGLIDAASRVVLFTGAGISTGSGIPDYRSPTGIWAQMKPILFQDYLASAAMRAEAWRRKFASDPVLRAARPNRGHRAVARLVADGKAAAVVTQNIDGLHQASGVPEDRLVELHGNATYAHCLDCGDRHAIGALQQVFEQQGEVPDCGHCGGLLKTATVSFGQPMPAPAMRLATERMLEADLCIVLGSSLVVHPAAGLPELARRNGARLAIVNREPTELDTVADLLVRDDIGQAMGDAVGVD